MSGKVKSRCWDDLLGPELAALCEARAGDASIPERPAIISVDLYELAYEGGPKPVDELLDEFPSSCGEYAWQAIAPTVALYDAARKAGIPIIHVTYDTREDTDVRIYYPTFRRRSPYSPGLYKIKEELAPLADELVVYKKRASGFFGTPMVSYLNQLDINGIIVVGESTSGCVRATVVDAWSNGYGTTVVEECVFDRNLLNHKVSLLDMHLKYCDVKNVAEVIAEFEHLAPVLKAGE